MPSISRKRRIKLMPTWRSNNRPTGSWNVQETIWGRALPLSYFIGGILDSKQLRRLEVVPPMIWIDQNPQNHSQTGFIEQCCLSQLFFPEYMQLQNNIRQSFAKYVIGVDSLTQYEHLKYLNYYYKKGANHTNKRSAIQWSGSMIRQAVNIVHDHLIRVFPLEPI
jgi:hypothetical protein